MPTSIELTQRLDSDIRAANIPIDGISGVTSPYDQRTVRVSPPELQPQCEPIINTFDPSQEAQDAWEADKEKSSANKFMFDSKSDSRAFRAEASMLVDEINVLRGWIVSFKAAVAASTTLADFKSRVAALPDLPDRTMAQAKAQFISKVNGGA